MNEQLDARDSQGAYTVLPGCCISPFGAGPRRNRGARAETCGRAPVNGGMRATDTRDVCAHSRMRHRTRERHRVRRYHRVRCACQTWTRVSSATAVCASRSSGVAGAVARISVRSYEAV